MCIPFQTLFQTLLISAKPKPKSLIMGLHPKPRWIKFKVKTLEPLKAMSQK